MVERNPHIVVMPPWISIVGIARLLIALIVLVLVAAAAGIWYTADYAAFGLTLFTVSTYMTRVMHPLTSYRHLQRSSSWLTTLSVS